MIKPSELRIGNLIDSFATGAPVTIKIQADHFRQLNATTDYVKPIPLTEEWLQRCGFEFRADDKVWNIQVGNTNYLEFDDEGLCGVTPESWRDQCPIYIWAEIKYVHQIQNLYFALTGNELQITE